MAYERVNIEDLKHGDVVLIDMPVEATVTEILENPSIAFAEADRIVIAHIERKMIMSHTHEWKQGSKTIILRKVGD